MTHHKFLAAFAAALAVAAWARAGRDDARPAPPATQPLRLERHIPLPQIRGGMNHLAADAKRGRAFVTATDDKSVAVVDVKAGKVIRLLEGQRPAAAAFAADLDQLCVSGAGGVTVYDGDSFAALAKIDAHGPVDELRYDPGEKRLYAGVMAADAPAIAVIDLPARKVLSQVKLPAKPQGFEVEAGGGGGTRVFVNTPGAKQVTVVDPKGGKVVGDWKLGDAQANYPMTLDEAGHRLFVGCRRPPVVVVLDTKTGRVVARAESAGDADDMGFDPASKTVLVACGDGGLSVIRQADPDHYRKLPDVRTPEGSRNGLFVPELKRFVLTVPRSGERPTELAVYGTPD